MVMKIKQDHVTRDDHLSSKDTAFEDLAGQTDPNDTNTPK